MSEAYQILAFITHLALLMVWRKDDWLNVMIKIILLVLTIWDVVLILTNMGYLIAP